MTEMVIKCDVCSKIKGQANHWHRFAESEYAFVVYGANSAVVDIECAHCDTAIRLDSTPTPKDACSETCLIKALSAYVACG